MQDLTEVAIENSHDLEWETACAAAYHAFGQPDLDRNVQATVRDLEREDCSVFDSFAILPGQHVANQVH
jgi:hypothetical protein